MFHLTRASRIGIVGAGPAGLCSGAKLKQAGFENVKIFEKSSELGGTWRYVPKPSPKEASSMYQNLRTNLPVQCMAFPDFPFQDLETSFPGHKEVLKYLQDYSNHHHVTDMIEYNNGVEAILNKTKEKPLWEIETEDGKSAEFDFVIVANGHYTKPYLPEIFENSSFKGEIIHSHVYRTPEKYLGKNVLVIGVGPSGTDISIDLTPFANSVSLLGAKEIPGLPKNIKMYVGWPMSVHETGIITNNNDEIECDSIIVSSGYQYDFSFLGDRLKLSECGKKVKNLYRQIIPASHPTIGCIGVPSIVVPFPLIECQVNWLLALWQNKIKLPPVEDRNEIASQVPGIGSPEIERHFHKMGSAQWSYNDLLAKEAGIDPIPRSIQALYEKVHFERREFGPVEYRKTKYTLLSNDTFSSYR